MSSAFSTETLEARRIGKKYSKSLKAGKELQPRLLCPAKLSFTSGEHIKGFPDWKKLKEITITNPLLYEILKGLI